MKTLIPTIASTLTVLALAVLPVQATTYTDSTADLAPTLPDILDISSVEVHNDSANLYFTVSLVGDISAVNWGKYCVGIDSVVGGGDTGTPVGNPWNRNISMSTAGMDFWLPTWVDGGGAHQEFGWNGSAWVQNGGSLAVTLTAHSVGFSVPLAYLGLSTGSAFNFDVYSTGGSDGDPAIDALANPSVTGGWGTSYASGSFVDSYTVAVPEPAVSALLGLGGLIAIQRIIRRRK